MLCACKDWTVESVGSVVPCFAGYADRYLYFRKFLDLIEQGSLLRVVTGLSRDATLRGLPHTSRCKLGRRFHTTASWTCKGALFLLL